MPEQHHPDTAEAAPTTSDAHLPESNYGLDSASDVAGAPPPLGLLRRIGSGAFFYGLGSALPQAMRFLLLPVFTWLLTPADYGILDLATSVGAFLMIAMRIGLPGAITRFYFDYAREDRLADYITTLTWFLVTASLLVATVCIAAGLLLQEQLAGWLPFLPYGALVVLTALFTSTANIQDRLLQAQEKASYVARLNLARSMTTILLSLALVVGLRWGAAGMLAADLLMSILFFIQAWVFLRPYLRGRFDAALLAPSSLYALGVLPSHLIFLGTPVLTRSLLAGADSLAALGLYGLAVRLSLPLIVLGASFQTAFVPVYYSLRDEHGANALPKIRGAVRQIWLLAVLAGVAVSVAGPPLVVLLTPASYHAAAPLVPLVAFGVLGHIAAGLASAEVFYRKHTWQAPIVIGSSAAVCIGITLATVNDYGVWGLAAATAASQWTAAAVYSAFSARLAHLPWRWLDLFRTLACGTLPTAAALCLPMDGALAQLGAALLALLATPGLLILTGDRGPIELLRGAMRQLKSSA